MNEAMNSRFCSIDFTLGSLILIAKENNSDFALVKDKFLNSENFINILLDFFQQNNIKIENLNFFMINLGPGGFVGLRNILSSIKSIALVKKIKILGFNNFQILKTTIVNQDFEKVALEVNNRFYIKEYIIRGKNSFTTHPLIITNKLNGRNIYFFKIKLSPFFCTI